MFVDVVLQDRGNGLKSGRVKPWRPREGSFCAIQQQERSPSIMRDGESTPTIVLDMTSRAKFYNLWKSKEVVLDQLVGRKAAVVTPLETRPQAIFVLSLSL